MLKVVGEAGALTRRRERRGGLRIGGGAPRILEGRVTRWDAVPCGT